MSLRPITAKLNMTRRTVLNKDTVRLVRLGNGQGQCDPPEIGYHWAQLPAGADENGNAKYSAPFRVRANPAGGYLPRAGYDAFIALRKGAWVVQGPSLDYLEQVGVDSRSLIAGTPEQAYIYLSDVVNFNALDLMDGLIVAVRELIFEINRVIKIWRGTDATLHFDLTPYRPTDVDTHLYALLVFNITKYLASVYPLEVYAGTAISLFTDLDEADLQTCYDAMPLDEEFFAIKAFYLEYGQTEIAGPSKDVDVRQWLNRSETQATITLTSPEGTLDITEVAPGAFELDVADASLTIPKASPLWLHEAATAPTITDDSGDGYSIGSRWIDTATDEEYVATDVTVGAAVWVKTTGGGAFAPNDATYLVQVADGDLPNAQAMGVLGTGLVKNTTATGVQSIAVANTDYVPPSGAILTSPVINTGVSGSAIDNDITLSGDSATLLPTQHAVKSYVDAVAQGLSVKYSVTAATVAALPANSYSNGTAGVGATITITATGVLTVDGQAMALNNRVLVKDESSASHNGIYLCTTAGVIGVAAVLTRATDMNQPAEIAGAFTFVENGTVNDGAGFVVADPGPFTIGTTAITWTQFSGAGEITAGSGLNKTGNTLSVDPAVVALLAGGQTISPTTLLTPTIASMINAQHNHQNPAGGGNITGAAFGSQLQNLVFIAPNGVSGIPTFRYLLNLDLPLILITTLDSNVINGAAVDPGTNDDNVQGYDYGSVWINAISKQSFVCLDPTPSSAVWRPTTELQQTSGKFYAGPTAGTAYPAFRSIVANDIPSLAASKITSGQLALARGGTNADLSAAGGTGFVLKQSSTGAAVTSAALAAADIPSLAASILTSGQVALARGGTNADLSATGGAHFVLKQTSAGAAVTVAALTAADIPTTITRNIQVFNTPGSDTYTIPTGTFYIEVICVAGGFGGGSGRRGATSTVRFGGGGGPGGNVTQSAFNATDLTSPVTVFVGTGGAGGAAQTVNDSNGNAGSVGTSSWFGGTSDATAYLVAINSAGSTGGQGGTNAAGLGGTGNVSFAQTLQFVGANGGDSSSVSAAIREGKLAGYGPGGGGGGAYITSGNVLGVAGDGGAANGAKFRASGNGGGGAAGVNSIGTAGANGTASILTPLGAGGGGGQNVTATSAGLAGGAGGLPGGGGGGGSASLNGTNSGAGGNGGNGAVIVIAYIYA